MESKFLNKKLQGGLGGDLVVSLLLSVSETKVGLWRSSHFLVKEGSGSCVFVFLTTSIVTPENIRNI